MTVNFPRGGGDQVKQTIYNIIAFSSISPVKYTLHISQGSIFTLTYYGGRGWEGYSGSCHALLVTISGTVD